MTTLLPPNATPLELALEAVAAERVRGLGRELASLWNPDTCPAHLLPVLAWSVRLPVWDEVFPKAVREDAVALGAMRRALVKRWLKVRRHLGTRFAIEEVVAVVGYRCEVREWFEYMDEEKRKEKTHFDVYIWSDENRPESSPDKEKRQIIERLVSEVKPLTASFAIFFGVRALSREASLSLLRVSKIKRFVCEVTP